MSNETNEKGVVSIEAPHVPSIVHCQLKDPSLYQKIFEAVGRICFQVRFVVSKRGIEIILMDSTRVVSCQVVLDVFDFLVYEFLGQDNLEVGLDMTDLFNHPKTLYNSATAKIKSMSIDVERLTLNIFDEETSTIYKIEYPTIDVEAENIPFDQLKAIDLSNWYIIKSKQWIEAIEVVSEFSEWFDLSMDSSSMKISTEGSFGVVECTQTKNIDLISKSPKKCEQTFTSSRLRNVNYGFLSESIKIAMDKESPLRFDIKLMDHSSIIYFIAPRMESENEDWD